MPSGPSWRSSRSSSTVGISPGSLVLAARSHIGNGEGGACETATGCWEGGGARGRCSFFFVGGGGGGGFHGLTHALQQDVHALRSVRSLTIVNVQRLQGAKHQPMEGLYSMGLPLLQRYMHVMQLLLHAEAPGLAEHLESEGVLPSMYCSQWFITIFAYNLPFDHLLRCWDIFLLEGVKVSQRLCAAPPFTPQIPPPPPPHTHTHTTTTTTLPPTLTPPLPVRRCLASIDGVRPYAWSGTGAVLQPWHCRGLPSKPHTRRALQIVFCALTRLGSRPRRLCSALALSC